MTIEQSPRRFAPWWYVGIALVAIVALIGIAFVWTNVRTRTAGNSAVSASSGAATQTSEGGNVTIKATWHGASAGPVFTIVMDTHAVDLDGYDLTQLAVLRTD